MRHCSKGFVYINSFKSPNNPLKYYYPHFMAEKTKVMARVIWLQSLPSEPPHYIAQILR